MRLKQQVFCLVVLTSFLAFMSRLYCGSAAAADGVSNVTYVWEKLPGLGLRENDVLEQDVVAWVLQKMKEGEEPVGLPPLHGRILMRRKNR